MGLSRPVCSVSEPLSRRVFRNTRRESGSLTEHTRSSFRHVRQCSETCYLANMIARLHIELLQVSNSLEVDTKVPLYIVKPAFLF